MELSEILNNIYSLPEESLALVVCRAERIAVAKNVLIVTAGRVCRDVYFVERGILRAFSMDKGRDITFWIGAEGSVALSMQSYINDEPGYESIVTIEPCVLHRISLETLRQLYRTDINIANWGRRFAEREVLRAEKSLIPQLFTTGMERYEALLREQPELLNRIPLENLASYLGLTPVSLSRIRRRIAGGC